MIVCLFAMALISVVLSVPLEGPAAAASPQEVVEASPELEAVPEAVIASPVVSPVVAPVAPVVAPTGQGSDVGGTGTITEHKNPDGSVVTITRFNGQIPPHLFPNNQFGNFTITHYQFMHSLYILK